MADYLVMKIIGCSPNSDACVTWVEKLVSLKNFLANHQASSFYGNLWESQNTISSCHISMITQG